MTLDFNRRSPNSDSMLLLLLTVFVLFKALSSPPWPPLVLLLPLLLPPPFLLLRLASVEPSLLTTLKLLGLGGGIVGYDFHYCACIHGRLSALGLQDQAQG
jgi:hypothetical protein